MPRLWGREKLYSTRLVSVHVWTATLGIVVYAAVMWVSGIMQGLMWREYDDQGFLVYSFAETVAAMFPYYVMRAFGGLLYLIGALIMVYNIWMTIRGRVREEAPVGGSLPALKPAEIGGHHGSFGKAQDPRGKGTPRCFWPAPSWWFTIGGIVEIAPLFYLENTIEKGRRHAALHAAGAWRAATVYSREGCYTCPQPDDPPLPATRGGAVRAL